MIATLFPGVHARAVAKVIDEVITLALHYHEVTGASPHLYFMNHAMKTMHNVVERSPSGGVHEFYIANPGLDFHVLVGEVENRFVAVMPQGLFLGATIQASSKGRYIVRLDRSLGQPVGGRAKRLLNEFVRAYEAVDVTV